MGVLVLSQYVEPAYALRLIEEANGGCGYLLKDRVLDASELVSALERIDAGELVIDAELVEQLLATSNESRTRSASSPSASARFSDLMAEGLTDRGIAERLWLTPRTVETHVRHILRKLEIGADATSNRRVHAVLAYLRYG